MALRPLSDQDTDRLNDILCDPAVCRFTPLAPLSDRAATRQFIHLCQKHADIGSVHSFAVDLTTHPGRLCGIVQVSRLSTDMEIGFLLAREQWGHRLMTEAVAALITWTKARCTASWMSASCDADHDAARQMFTDLGFTCSGILPRFRVHPALGRAPRDCAKYRLKVLRV